MNIEQITALVNAGFTKEEIMTMTAPAQEPAQAQAQEPAQAQTQEQLSLRLKVLQAKLAQITYSHSVLTIVQGPGQTR